jgi:hypothetical protein
LITQQQKTKPILQAARRVGATQAMILIETIGCEALLEDQLVTHPVAGPLLQYAGGNAKSTGVVVVVVVVVVDF